MDLNSVYTEEDKALDRSFFALTSRIIQKIREMDARDDEDISAQYIESFILTLESALDTCKNAERYLAERTRKERVVLLATQGEAIDLVTKSMEITLEYRATVGDTQALLKDTLEDLRLMLSESF